MGVRPKKLCPKNGPNAFFRRYISLFATTKSGSRAGVVSSMDISCLLGTIPRSYHQ